MKKAALFYTAWTESIGRLETAAAQTGFPLVPIHYSQLTYPLGPKDKGEILFQGQSLRRFALFYFRNVGDRNEHLPLLLDYAQRHQIPLVDEYLGRLGGAMRKRKLAEAYFLQQAGVAYPTSFYTADLLTLQQEVKKRKKPLIVKSISGRHGTSTFLIEKEEDLFRALRGRFHQGFLIQEYIPNDGDYRLFLIGYRVVAGFKRQRKEKKLVLNRSLGPSQPLERIPPAIVKEAQRAAQVLGVEIAGIDAVIDERSGQPVIIEVNQAPEFYVMERRTGVAIGAAIIDYLKSQLK